MQKILDENVCVHLHFPCKVHFVLCLLCCFVSQLFLLLFLLSLLSMTFQPHRLHVVASVCVCVFYLFVFPTFQLKRYVPPGPVVSGMGTGALRAMRAQRAAQRIRHIPYSISHKCLGHKPLIDWPPAAPALSAARKLHLHRKHQLI